MRFLAGVLLLASFGFPLAVWSPPSASHAFFQPQSDPTSNLVITRPSEGDLLSGTIRVEGTAAVSGMTSYRLEFSYDPNSTGDWFPIAEGSEPVRQGILGVWDTAGISDGAYLLRLSAVLGDGTEQTAPDRRLSIRHVVNRADSNQVPPAVEGSAIQPALFPAPTSALARPGMEEPAAAETFSAVQATALLIGAGAALAAFAAWRLRSQWHGWRRRQFIRRTRKNG